MRLTHRFVEFIPKDLEDNVLYISIRFRTAVHKCVCGCGIKTVTPFSPTDWKLTFNGKSVSLYPSIGNWGFPCRSHYWITENQIDWAPQWSDEEIKKGRKLNYLRKDEFYDQQKNEQVGAPPISSKKNEPWWAFKWLYR